MRCEPVDTVISGRAPAELACEFCGCTEDNACIGGCHWVSINPPICSACEAVGADVDRAVGPAGVFSEQRCAGSESGRGHLDIWLTDSSGYCARCREAFVL
jgi:hypothetical protein